MLLPLSSWFFFFFWFLFFFTSSSFSYRPLPLSETSSTPTRPPFSPSSYSIFFFYYFFIFFHFFSSKAHQSFTSAVTVSTTDDMMPTPLPMTTLSTYLSPHHSLPFCYIFILFLLFLFFSISTHCHPKHTTSPFEVFENYVRLFCVFILF